MEIHTLYIQPTHALTQESGRNVTWVKMQFRCGTTGRRPCSVDMILNSCWNMFCSSGVFVIPVFLECSNQDAAQYEACESFR